MEKEQRNLNNKKASSKKVKRKARKIDKRKVLIFLIGVIIVVVLSIKVADASKINKKEKKAEEVFGNDYCNSVLHMATKDLTPHTCSICGEEFEDSSMRANICDECSKELDRCDFCGKKLSEEVKKERSELLGE